jgi:hypothetical protein
MNYDNLKHYDIIIIGSGMSGLYSAYYITQNFPNMSFIILEKFKKEWIGGRTSNDTFYGTQIVTGAGIGRRDTNPLLIQLMNELHVPFKNFLSVMDYSKMFLPLNIIDMLNHLKKEYKKHPELHHKTFKQFFTQIFGEKMYKQFLISSGYTDFENADLYETIYNYGMDDNTGGWNGLYIPWKKLVDKLYHTIGKQHFKFSCDVVKINPIKDKYEKPCLFEIITKNGDVFLSNKVIVATTISSIQKLIPVKQNLYQQIHGQPFLRLYGKFNKKSSEIMKKYVPHYTIVPGPLQKIIPMNSSKGVYMIAYSDNNNALILKDHLDNTPQNRKLYCQLIEQSLGIPDGSLTLIAIKDYYWPIGTHYYEPLSKEFLNRNQFLDEVQHPEKGILVVGEAVSRYQGWVEGALESVKKGLTKKWILDKC